MKATILLVSLFAICGCSHKRPIVVEEVPMGTFAASVPESSADGVFRITGNPTNWNLGFAVKGLAQDSPEQYVAQFKAVLNELASERLRLRLQLFLDGSTNDFYRAEFPLGRTLAPRENGSDRRGANYVYSGFENRPLPLFFFAGIAPLGVYHDWDLRGEATVDYRFDRDLVPLKFGKLIPGVAYKVRLTVLHPLNTTNEFQLWLYGWRDKTQN